MLPGYIGSGTVGRFVIAHLRLILDFIPQDTGFQYIALVNIVEDFLAGLSFVERHHENLTDFRLIVLIVIPVGPTGKNQELLCLYKTFDGKIIEEARQAVRFVPMRESHFLS